MVRPHDTAVIADIALPSVVEERATCLLRHAAYTPLTTLRCEFHDGILTVRGRVPSFHLKQVAQVLLRDLDGVGVIDNRVDVEDFRPQWEEWRAATPDTGRVT